jgi:hypothetical protein
MNKMAGVIENYSKSEVRAVVKCFRAEGLIESEICRRLVSVYGQKVFSRKVSMWCNKFRDGRTAWNYVPDKQGGRPRTSDVIMESLIIEDRELTFEKRIAKASQLLHILLKGTLP